MIQLLTGFQNTDSSLKKKTSYMLHVCSMYYKYCVDIFITSITYVLLIHATVLGRMPIYLSITKQNACTTRLDFI